MPLAARLSIAGVWMSPPPMRQLIASANCWSVMMNRMFGRRAVEARVRRVPSAPGARRDAPPRRTTKFQKRSPVDHILFSLCLGTCYQTLPREGTTQLPAPPSSGRLPALATNTNENLRIGWCSSHAKIQTSRQSSRVAASHEARVLENSTRLTPMIFETAGASSSRAGTSGSAAGRQNGRRLYSESATGWLLAGYRLREQRAGVLADPASPEPALGDGSGLQQTEPSAGRQRGLAGRRSSRALPHWTQNDYINPNWWYMQIGVPQVMAPILILMGETVPPELKEQTIQRVLGRSKMGMTGQNKVWLAEIAFMKGVLANDPDLMAQAQSQIFSELHVTTQEGVQPDYSFHQHGPQQQWGNYGGAFGARHDPVGQTSSAGQATPSIRRSWRSCAAT